MIAGQQDWQPVSEKQQAMICIIFGHAETDKEFLSPRTGASGVELDREGDH
jgi:hypothetical protein